ncbi:dihydroorotase [Advenella incenata]|uniref:Dihydroorotase n=1 Tax=Advenella incenata TaxID=267800 RepID=A0A4Q7VEF9_9BURK|nr:D-aminoacylase [Advenella incenata]RZT94577.1 dihydroorotase [Advenella incenata]
MHDFILSHGSIIDGSGKPRVTGDVALKDGRISAIGDLTDESAARRIDCSERIISPGFIDCHCHSELSLIANPGAESKVRQGVTTEVLGNCGWSTFPLAGANAAAFREQASPIFGHPTIEWNWVDLNGYFERVFKQGAAVNVATLTGHGALRAAVMGLEARAPTLAELESMKTLLHQTMQQGSLGLSSGLCYVPGVYADSDELVALAGIVNDYGGLYATHMRDQVDGLLQSVDESLDVALRAHIPLLISHHKTSGARNYGKTRLSLAKLDEARQHGLTTYSDMYPYLAGSTTLSMLFPPWVLDGGRDAMMERLASNECRARIRHDWTHGIPGWENRIAALGWQNITISYLKHAERQVYVGLTVLEAAQQAGQEVCDFVFDLMLAEQGEVGQIMQNSCEEDLRNVLTHAHSMIGSDGLDVGDHPHPRQYGTFPKVLGELVRDKGWMTLEESIFKMTGYTARTFRLGDMGLLKQGYRANITVFDPANVQANATYENPRQFASGIEWVFVNGRPTLADGVATGDLAGTAVRRC